MGDDMKFFIQIFPKFINLWVEKSRGAQHPYSLGESCDGFIPFQNAPVQSLLVSSQ